MPNSVYSFDHLHFKSTFNSPEIELISKRLSSNILLDENSEILWLLRAISVCDMTTLMGDDSISNVRRLCSKSLNPLSPKSLSLLKNKLKIDAKGLVTAAVCVYPSQVKEVRIELAGHGVNIASVAAGFPSGQYPLHTRLLEIQHCISEGANEIDIVINRTLVHQGQWQELYDELVAMRNVCTVKLKTILEVGQLGSYKNIYHASMIAMLAGADFIKTSTGKECTANATLPMSLTMLMAIGDFHDATGVKVGFKPAGGIRTSTDALKLMFLQYNMLGEQFLNSSYFRLGCSSLIISLEKRILAILSGNNWVDQTDIIIS